MNMQAPTPNPHCQTHTKQTHSSTIWQLSVTTRILTYQSTYHNISRAPNSLTFIKSTQLIKQHLHSQHEAIQLFRYYAKIFITFCSSANNVNTWTHNMTCTCKRKGAHTKVSSILHLYICYKMSKSTQRCTVYTIVSARHIYVNIWKSKELTPCWCRYWTVETMTCMTALASLSEKNLCLRILSSNSPPLISSITRYTDLSSSYTCKISLYTH